MRRYLGCGPDVLRQRGGFDYALDMFLGVVTVEKNGRGSKRTGVL